MISENLLSRFRAQIFTLLSGRSLSRLKQRFCSLIFTRGLSFENMIQPKSSSLLFYLKKSVKETFSKIHSFAPNVTNWKWDKKACNRWWSERKREIEMLCWYRALDFVDEDSRHELNAMPHRPYYIFFLIDLSTRNSILCSIFGENWHLYL